MAASSSVSRFLSRIASPYPAASIAALALVNGADSLIEPGPLNASYVASLVGLVLGVGVLHGLLWQGVLALLQRAPRALSLGVWMFGSLVCGTALAASLNAFALLDGPYQTLASIVLAACSVGALALGALLIGMQPSAAGGAWLQTRSRKLRTLAALVLLGAGIALAVVDRMVYVDIYVDAHTALRFACVWLGMFAFVLCDPELRVPRLSLGGALGIVLATAVPLWHLDEHEQLALQAFRVRTWPALLLEVGRTLCDFDMDGEASLLAGGDCAPFDPSVHPSAREVPDNGIDDNCMFGDAKRMVERVEQLPMPKEPSPLDVVLITVDALRPDHLGTYNPAYGPRGRYVAPSLDRFAQNATVFDHAYTAGGWTSISVPTLMRGLYARRLRWTRYYETNRFAIIRKPVEPKLQRGERVERSFLFAYDDPHPPLAHQLRRRGMYTAAIVDDGVSEILRPGLSLDFGFNLFRNMDAALPRDRTDAGTTNMALSTLRQLPSGQRFFLWVHYFGVHAPDQTHPEVPSYGPRILDHYDHEIAYLDRELGRLLTALGQRRNVAVFVTADHGEAITRDARMHGQTLDEDVIRVPLIARVPGWPVGRVPGLVSLVDLVPTILGLTRTPAPSRLDGRDMAPIATGTAPPQTQPRILLSDTWRYGMGDDLQIEQVAAFDGRNKVVFDRAHQLLSAYDTSVLDAPPTPVDPFGDALSQAIFGYIDETGGQLEPHD